MRKLVFLLIPFLIAAAPSRPNDYSANTTIRSAEVNEDFNTIYNHLQAGVEVIADGVITNDDINAAAGITASKLNLSSISQNISHSGTLTQSGGATLSGTNVISGSTSFTTITNLGAVTTADINGGTIDGAIVGATSPAAGTFTTVKIGTANQGDIFYDNGTYVTRLTPGTSGQFLKTQGTGANPQWANVGASNVIFQWYGVDSAQAGTNTHGVNLTTTLNKDFSSHTPTYVVLGAYGTTYRTVLLGKFTKPFGVSTVTIFARLWSSDSAANSEAIINVDVGGQSNTTKSVTTDAPAWAASTTIDISSLTAGETYDITIQLKSEATASAYCSAVVLIGS